MFGYSFKTVEIVMNIYDFRSVSKEILEMFLEQLYSFFLARSF